MHQNELTITEALLNPIRLEIYGISARGYLYFEGKVLTLTFENGNLTTDIHIPNLHVGEVLLIG